MKRLLPAALLLLCGCVDRLISVRSDPPGASVLLDGDPAGTTPVDIPYSWYGTRDLTIELRGFRSVTRRVELLPPWWQCFPFDLLTDVLLPFRLTDRTEIHFMMEEDRPVPEDAEGLRSRAEELRERLK